MARFARRYRLIAEDRLTRRWVCQVVRTGYHNGANCNPDEPHSLSVWGCGYRTEVSLTDDQVKGLARLKVIAREV